MAQCNLKNPTVTTEDGREIEAPLFKELKKIINPIEARITYNDIISEDFKSQPFWADITLNGYVDKYGQPTIEGLLKYTDFSTRVSLTQYADSIKKDLFNNDLEISNTSDFKNSLHKLREFNNKSKYYKAVLVKTNEKAHPFDIIVVRNSYKAAKLIGSVEAYLDNISTIETKGQIKDLFKLIVSNYTVNNASDTLNSNSIVDAINGLKNGEADYTTFSKILPDLPVYSSSNGLKLSKMIAGDVDFMLNYLKTYKIVNTENEEALLAALQKNPKTYAGLIKNHLLYMAYKDTAIGDIIIGNSDTKYVQNILNRLHNELINDINNVNISIPDPSVNPDVEIPEFKVGSFFSRRFKELAANEKDIINKIYILEKESADRFYKLYGKKSYSGGKLKKLSDVAEKGNTIEGLIDYVNDVMRELQSLYKKVNSNDNLPEKAKIIKMLLDKCTEYENVIDYFNTYTESNSFDEDVKSYLQSILDENKIGLSIDDITADNMESLFNNENDDSVVLDSKYREIFSDYLNQSFRLTELDSLTAMVSRYKTNLIKTAVDTTAQFLEQYQTAEGETVAFGKNKGQKVDIRALLEKADTDINIYNKLFSAMADCPDTIFRLTDKAMKTSKGKARLETQDLMREIKKEALLLEQSGIKGFDWMYGKDAEGKKTGYYITKSTNPTAYNAIMSDSRKKRFYEFFMKTKNELDMMYPDNTTEFAKIIGIRKDRLERFKSLKGVKDAGKQLIEGIKDNYMERSDDEDIAGYSELFTDSKGNEIKMLPVYYNNFDMKDADEMSEDAVSTLISYASKAIEYKHLDNLIDLIEIEKIALKERKMPSTDGKLKVLNLFNKIAYKDDKSSMEENTVYHKDEGTSNAYKMFDAWVDMQFYGRWRQREGTIGNTNISSAKAVDMLNKKTAIASMSLNLLNGISNVMTGISQTRIETIVGSLGKGYVGVKDMAKADTTYMAELPKFLGDLGKRVKTSKLALFSEMLNVSQEYESDITETQWHRDNKLKRLATSNALSFVQNSGEHYMAHRMAIAVAIHTKLKDSQGNEKTLWDALKVEYIQEDGIYGSENKGLGARLTLDGKYTLNGKEFTFEGEDLYKLERKITGINQKIHGIYNKQDANIIQRYSLGRLVYMFRKWIPAAIDKRFMNEQYNYDTEEWKEGYYRTAYDFLKQLWHEREGLKFNTIVKFKALSEEQRANILRALTESLIFFATLLAGKAMIPDDDDKKKQSWAYNMLRYQLTRLTSELAALTPVSLPNISQNMLSESLKLFKSPIAAANTAQDSYSILGLLNPYAYFEDVKSGKYKDHSKAYKIIMSNRFWNPLGTLWYKNRHPEAFIGWYK